MNKKEKILIRNLNKTFITESGRDIPVLEDINLTIYDNEFLLVIGPSGCGKTTLLSCIAGFETPSSGSITMDGKLITKPGSERGVVFQETAVFPWRKVQKNVEYGLEIKKFPRARRKAIATEYLKMVGLEDFHDVYPKELSGGMKKRLTIATVYANEPEVLLMDEPFSALDYPTKCRLQMDLMDIWSQKKKTTVFISHDVEEAILLSDRIIVLNDRKIALEYVNPFPRPRKDELRDAADFVAAKEYIKEAYWNENQKN